MKCVYTRVENSQRRRNKMLDARTTSENIGGPNHSLTFHNGPSHKEQFLSNRKKGRGRRTVLKS